MLQETWNTFPLQLVQKINGLLDQAQPSSLKSYHIYKMCKNEGLWENSFSEFSFYLQDYFNTPINDRSKSLFDRFLKRPMDWHSYEFVGLNFRTADIQPAEIRDIASWAHHMLRLHYQKTSDFFGIDTLNQTIYQLTHPSHIEKDQNIEFEDFCEAWKKTADRLFGKKFEVEQKLVLADLRQLNFLIEKAAQAGQSDRQSALGRLYLTQTEIYWVEDVLKAVSHNNKMPKYPLSKGPSKPRLIDLLKWLTLWEISKLHQATAIKAKNLQLAKYLQSECEDLLQNCLR